LTTLFKFWAVPRGGGLRRPSIVSKPWDTPRTPEARDLHWLRRRDHFQADLGFHSRRNWLVPSFQDYRGFPLQSVAAESILPGVFGNSLARGVSPRAERSLDQPRSV